MKIVQYCYSKRLLSKYRVISTSVEYTHHVASTKHHWTLENSPLYHLVGNWLHNVPCCGTYNTQHSLLFRLFLVSGRLCCCLIVGIAICHRACCCCFCFCARTYPIYGTSIHTLRMTWLGIDHYLTEQNATALYSTLHNALGPH